MSGMERIGRDAAEGLFARFAPMLARVGELLGGR